MVEKTCLFCDIIARKREATIVLEDDKVIVLMDIAPINPGHMLAIPKTHCQHVEQMGAEEAAHLFITVTKLAGAVRKAGVQAEGLWIMLNDGQVAGQEVFHAHFHIIPRYPVDGIGLHFSKEFGKQPPRSELEALADRIRARLPEEDTPKQS